MHTVRIQRVVFHDDDAEQNLYFRARGGTQFRRGVRVRSRRSANLSAACIFSTDTYFNALFPAHWCALADIDAFVLKVGLSGTGTLRIVRAALGEVDVVVAEIPFAGDNLDLAVSIDVENSSLRRPCLVYLEIRVADDNVLFERADWFASSRFAKEVRLVGGYCTFQREQYLLSNIDRLVRDEEAFDVIRWFIVVDNGRSARLAQHFAAASDRFRYHAQDNVGGAGGFARVILEAGADPAVTHILLMDDDAVIEPESVFRLAAAFAVSREPVALGGHMLDALHRTILLEAGARYVPEKLKVQSLWSGLDVLDRGNLLLVSKPYRVDYNAWWFFGFPAEAAVTSGLPLPFFLRTDDIEFGYRLQKQGIATWTLPGMAVWHEPFYAKVGGWQSYFATRNLLISAAVHQERWAKRAARTNLRRIVTCLLSLDYYEAWLHIRAAQDFLAGPSVIEQPQTEKLKELLAGRRSLGPSELEKTRALRPLPLRRKLLYAPLLRKLERRLQILRHWALPASRMRDQDDLEGAIDGSELAWWNLAVRDFFAINHHFSFNYTVRQRDPATFRRLYAEARRLNAAIIRDEARLTDVWRDAFRRLTVTDWWLSYLGVKDVRSAPATARKTLAAPVSAAADLTVTKP